MGVSEDRLRGIRCRTNNVDSSALAGSTTAVASAGYKVRCKMLGIVVLPLQVFFEDIPEKLNARRVTLLPNQ